MPQFYYKYGVTEDKNGRFRRTMEDTHVHEPNINGVHGQGFFAVFDGHGGKKTAAYCEEVAFKSFLDIKQEFPNLSTPEVFDKTFAIIDEGLKTQNIMFSGATAIIAYLEVQNDQNGTDKKTTLYTANVGDARAVLCRAGRAIRLSYDHKASDPFEQQRITEAGGVILGDRVSGSLAITRAIGDLALKHLVVSHPYTTETTITKDDSLLILACDGVWDVLSDQDAVDLIKDIPSAQEASELLLKKSLEKGTTDNLSVMVVKFQEEVVENPVEKVVKKEEVEEPSQDEEVPPVEEA
jgi:protein phosphatase PTC1